MSRRTTKPSMARGGHSGIDGRAEADTPAPAVPGSRAGDRALSIVASRLVLVRIGFGAVWAVDAYLKWQRSFMDSLPMIIATNAQDQPGWLGPWFRFWKRIASDHTLLIGYTGAVVESLIAVCLILGLARRVVYIGGALWAVGIWSVAEGFGPTLVPGASDIGAAIMYSFIFAVLYWLEATISPVGMTLDAPLQDMSHRWRMIGQPGGKAAMPVAANIHYATSHPFQGQQPRERSPR